jgi:hypothetical protein
VPVAVPVPPAASVNVPARGTLGGAGAAGSALTAGAVNRATAAAMRRASSVTPLVEADLTRLLLSVGN